MNRGTEGGRGETTVERQEGKGGWQHVLFQIVVCVSSVWADGFKLVVVVVADIDLVQRQQKAYSEPHFRR